METYGLEQIPLQMKEFFDERSGKAERDDVQSALTKFNYGNLYYYE